MTTSAPRLRTSSAFSPLAVVATVAPRCLASWMTVEPRPPAPAWTRTFWPGLTRAGSTRACQAASDTSGSAAASCRVSEAGLGAMSSWSIAMYSAKAPIRRSRGASVDLVTHLEVASGRAGPGHRAGDIVAEHERGLVLQEPLERAVADHLV